MYYCDSFNVCYNTNDSWYIWGRWALLGAIILFTILVCVCMRCINARRIKRGGGPVRYTGWTVPAYNQSQQQYGYTSDQNAYNMNNYPPGQYPPGQNPPAQQGQYSYQGPQQVGNDGPAYYDATQTEAHGGYQPPAYPPAAARQKQ